MKEKTSLQEELIATTTIAFVLSLILCGGGVLLGANPSFYLPTAFILGFTIGFGNFIAYKLRLAKKLQRWWLKRKFGVDLGDAD